MGFSSMRALCRWSSGCNTPRSKFGREGRQLGRGGVFYLLLLERRTCNIQSGIANSHVHRCCIVLSRIRCSSASYIHASINKVLIKIGIRYYKTYNTSTEPCWASDRWSDNVKSPNLSLTQIKCCPNAKFVRLVCRSERADHRKLGLLLRTDDYFLPPKFI